MLGVSLIYVTYVFSLPLSPITQWQLVFLCRPYSDIHFFKSSIQTDRQTEGLLLIAWHAPVLCDKWLAYTCIKLELQMPILHAVSRQWKHSKRLSLHIQWDTGLSGWAIVVDGISTRSQRQISVSDSTSTRETRVWVYDFVREYMESFSWGFAHECKNLFLNTREISLEDLWVYDFVREHRGDFAREFVRVWLCSWTQGRLREGICACMTLFVNTGETSRNNLCVYDFVREYTGDFVRQICEWLILFANTRELYQRFRKWIKWFVITRKTT
jgi:hypothetical protein